MVPSGSRDLANRRGARAHGPDDLGVGATSSLLEAGTAHGYRQGEVQPLVQGPVVARRGMCVDPKPTGDPTAGRAPLHTCIFRMTSELLPRAPGKEASAEPLSRRRRQTCPRGRREKHQVFMIPGTE